MCKLDITKYGNLMSGKNVHKCDRTKTKQSLVYIDL